MTRRRLQAEFPKEQGDARRVAGRILGDRREEADRAFRGEPPQEWWTPR